MLDNDATLVAWVTVIAIVALLVVKRQDRIDTWDPQFELPLILLMIVTLMVQLLIFFTAGSTLSSIMKYFTT